VSGLSRALVATGIAATIAVSPVVSAGAVTTDAREDSASPIKHVVIIIGENHTFDNVFATYQPRNGQHVKNLLSEGIVTRTGGVGPSAAKATQREATDTTTYTVTPPKTSAYPTLPQPDTTYVAKACDGLDPNSPDTRFSANLANAPYQITKYVPYYDDHGQYMANGTCEFIGAFVGDPLHRFYQMYQQIDGGKNDLFTWVHQTAGDSNGAPPTGNTHQGGLAMGFYNVATGDAPVLRGLADRYAMSDNYHQSVMGGTGANHIMLGFADDAFYQDATGKATTPPAGEIENPNPQPGTNNFYTQDGYGKSGTTNGGSYSNCSDHSQPGVKGVFDYFATLQHQPFKDGDCAPGHYYLLNNYSPGYKLDGSLNTSTFTVPPQHNVNTIADELQAKGVSWGYYGEGVSNGKVGPNYCDICNPFLYAASVMTDPAKRVNAQHSLPDFDAAVADGTLPAVVYLKPGDDDGHAGYSALPAFEAFASHAITAIQNQPELWKSTAILVTMDEGGGYYDSGDVQPVSFFGDGTRIPMIVVSPFAKRGFVDHTYTDHVSVLKFIEANWKLDRLSERSLDNLPNPRQPDGAYLPDNGPAIGDLMSLFDFGASAGDQQDN
jgi:acid phosphatase